MGYFLMQLTLNVTPLSIDHQAKVLLQYAAPVAYGELRTALSSAAERLKRDGAAVGWKREDGSAGQMELTEEGRLRIADPWFQIRDQDHPPIFGEREEEMDIAAEAWARELMA
ncbi:MAG: hypothetical protein B7X10_05120 [Burkholderiales bacterium 21-58-4]|nr:MAG: hypothetical protein B7X10_05120 [Burkholderiales bacterium 21-58-4]